MKQHVRKLWDAAARWGYRDGYADGYFDGTQNKKQRSNVQQPFHFEAPIGEPWTSRPMNPMFAERIAFEERTSAPWAVPNSSSPHSRGSRITSPLSASTPGIPHSNSFSAAMTLPSLRLSHGRSPYPKRSTSPSSSDVTASSKRFSCEACEKDFSRAHDKKRHYETQHDRTTVAHRCMYCEKNFSRYVLAASISCASNLLQSGFFKTASSYLRRLSDRKVRCVQIDWSTPKRNLISGRSSEDHNIVINR
jgi:hypothetical protein